MDSEHLLILLISGFQDMTLDFVINRWRARLKGGRRSLVILQTTYQNRKNSKITKLFLRGLRCPSTPPARAIVSSGRPPWRQRPLNFVDQGPRAALGLGREKMSKPGMCRPPIDVGLRRVRTGNMLDRGRRRRSQARRLIAEHCRHYIKTLLAPQKTFPEPPWSSSAILDDRAVERGRRLSRFLVPPDGFSAAPSSEAC